MSGNIDTSFHRPPLKVPSESGVRSHGSRGVTGGLLMNPGVSFESRIHVRRVDRNESIRDDVFMPCCCILRHIGPRAPISPTLLPSASSEEFRT